MTSRLQPANGSDLFPKSNSRSKMVGYTVLRPGMGDITEACILVPHVGTLKSVSHLAGSKGIEVDIGGVRIGLPELPQSVSEALLRNRKSVLLVTVDTLSRARSSMHVGEIYVSGDSDSAENKARSDLNDFLGRIVKNGSVRVEHVRVRTRQPSTEVLARKAMFAVKHQAPATALKVSVVELRTNGTAGPADLGEAAALFMNSSHPALAKFLGSTNDVRTGAQDGALTSGADTFSLLHAYSEFEAVRRLSAAPGITSGAISVSAGISNSLELASIEVKNAADSVYAQSFADVHAISLLAAFAGNDIAKDTLDTVLATRSAGGDFNKFSLAPLSHDTRMSIKIMDAQLNSGKDFAAMSRDELWEHSRWAAAEGTAAWMQFNGVEYQNATNMREGLDATMSIVAMASNSARPSGTSRQLMRPTV